MGLKGDSFEKSSFDPKAFDFISRNQGGFSSDAFSPTYFDPNAFDFRNDRVVSAVTGQISLTPYAAEVTFDRHVFCRTNYCKLTSVTGIIAKSLVFKCAAQIFSLSTIKAVVSDAVFRSRPQRNIVPHKPTISIVINLGD